MSFLKKLALSRDFIERKVWQGGVKKQWKNECNNNDITNFRYIPEIKIKGQL